MSYPFMHLDLQDVNVYVYARGDYSQHHQYYTVIYPNKGKSDTNIKVIIDYDTFEITTVYLAWEVVRLTDQLKNIIVDYLYNIRKADLFIEKLKLAHYFKDLKINEK